MCLCVCVSSGCQCSGPGCLDGSCDLVSGHAVCRSGFQGSQCDQCAPGYFNYPLCQRESPEAEILICCWSFYIDVLNESPALCVRLRLQCVAAAQSALCPKAAMRLVVVCADQSFRVLDVNSADLVSTPTPTVKVHTHTHTHAET